MFGSPPEHPLQRGEFQDPQKIGVAFDVLAGIEDQPLAFQKIAGVAEADECILTQGPAL